MPHSHADFVHLHVHTQYSLLDGACLIEGLLEQAASYKLPSLAITDHGNLFGAVEFYRQAMSCGIKPIIGCEVYVAPDSRFEKSVHGIQEASFHLILLSKDEEGYKNLIKLVSLGYLEGFYYRPRVDKEILQKYSKGLIALSACLKGEIPHLIQNEQMDRACSTADEYRNIFGSENFYFEIMDNGIREQEKVNRALAEMSKKMGIPLVATNDIHYLRKEHARAHEALLCIQTQTTLDDPNRFKMQTDEFYLKSPKQMKDAFKDFPEAITNTVAIAERCNLELDFSKAYLPKYQPPEGKTKEQFLVELCQDGLKRHYGEIDEPIRARFKHELDIIQKSGYISYFLIAWDFIQHAKSKGIPVGPGRGSAAGSLVSYSLGITDIDPLKYGLLFERFLNPERVSLPDIDIDFCYERRSEVIDYVTNKYSKENVAQIITFGAMLAKAVIRDVARAMGFPYAEADRIAKLIPGSNIKLSAALEAEPELKELYKNNPRVKDLIDTSMVLEGITRHASTHAAGVVISQRPLIEHIPLFKTSDDQVTTGFPMTSLEKIGLLKMDFLGLRTLTVISEAVKIIKRTQGKDIDISEIPLDDANTFKLLAGAKSIGVFQLESTGMRDLLKKLKPTKFEDIIALLALFRPGPIGSGMTEDFVSRKHGKVKIKYDHPKLEPILKDTYGIILYQEQVMQIASELAGFSLSEADNLRRAMSKKTPEVMQQARDHFINGAQKNGVDKRIADKVFSFIEYFSGYGFNKCVAGDTEVIDAETGRAATVKELYRQNKRIEILSCNEKLKLEKKPVTNIFENGVKPVYKVKTALGKEITITDNHPLLTVGGWRELRELAAGDMVALPRVMPVNTEGQALADYQIIALAGVLSEGNTCHPSGVYYYNNDRTVINDFVENVRQFNITDPTVTVRRGNHYEVYAGTGRDAKFSAGQNPWNKGISWKRGLRYGGAMLESEAGPEKSGFRIWIEELGLAHKKSADKFIPRDIFALPPDKLALFLGRLWSGDGYIYGKSSIAPFYSTSSKKLSMQLQQLLLRFGILSRVAKKTFKYAYKNIHKEKRGYIVLLQGRAGVEVFLGQICPHVLGKDRAIRGLKEYYRTVPDKMESPDVIPAEIKIKVKAIKDKLGVGWRELEARSGICMKEFYGSVKPRKRGFRRSTIRKLGEYLESPELLRYASSDIYWDRIRSISYVGEEPTYDLEVKDTHNFIANGIIVHNSHSTAYAMISYRTAYLKANYPVEFMTALLTSEKDNMDKIVDYISQSNKMGIKILPPDIKESFAKFTVVRPKDSEPAIRFGLSAVKNVGQGAIDSIIEARKVFGFNSLQDFCQHIDSRLVNRKVIESLIKCGAFDSFGYRRSQLMSIVDKVLDVASDMQKDRARGQYSFFDDFSNGEAGFGANLLSDVPDIQEWPEHQLLAYEKEMLGFYLTKHPLTRYERLLRTFCGCSTKTTSKFRDGQEIAMGGIFTKVKNTVTKRTGEKMAIATLEDLDGTIEVLVFPSSYQKVGGFVKVDNFVYIKGRLSLREESPKLIAGDIMSLDEAQYKCARVVNILVKNNGQDKNTFDSLKRILSRNRGQVPVCLTFKKEGDSHVDMLIGRDYYVHPSERLSREVEELLGQNTICLRS